MLFSSIVFIFIFLPVTLLVYHLLYKRRTAQNVWLLLVSLIFYAWGEPVNVLLMIASIFVNWGMGLLVDRNRSDQGRKKLLLIIACVYNIGVLFVFKYLGFFIDTANMVSKRELVPNPGIALPIGISFYTFQALSYVIDVYRDDIKVEKNPFYVGLYVAFFPQLIAGPIVRYNSIAEQIRNRKGTLIKLSVGTTRFVTGLGKKILLSNSLAILADQVFNWSAMGTENVNTTVVMAWMGAVAYTLQIYFDFSGYSDMAIGLALMFGFKLEENFNYPYIAKSVNDFWRRWHISLTTWFREYVYIPLGGNRVSNKDKMIRNMFVVWLLTGIWHGASFNFLFWGLWHFLFQLSERFFGYDKNNDHPVIMRVYTLLEVILGWVLFRASDLYQAGIYFRNMFGTNGNTFFDDSTAFMLREYWMYLALGAVFSLPIAPRMNKLLFEHRTGRAETVLNCIYPVAILLLFFVSVSYLVRGGYNPFIYFDF